MNHHTVETKLLVDCEELIPTLSELWYHELGKYWIPDASIDRARKNFASHLNRDQLPLTYVAFIDKKAVGMASLRVTDGIRLDLTPWLGSLIVHPNYRTQGVGQLLIEITKKEAQKREFSKLHLFTFDIKLPSWYAKLGWQTIGSDEIFNHPVTVMECKIN